ncbi:hypothetical protein ASC72_10235 [Flavobacterium sp. Root420]|nr:hypothetical protein ASC72_10235 [Flavobacterium sp. Root420]
MWHIRGTAKKNIKNAVYKRDVTVLFESLFLHEGPKTREKQDFQSFQKRPKKSKNPGNTTICRVFSFITLFNIYKNTQKLCGAFSMEWIPFL